MSILDYLFYSVIGVCVVFATLVMLMVIIKVLTALTTPKAPAPAATVPTAAEHPASSAPIFTATPGPLAPGSAGEVALYDTDPRDAAMIMAIVADELQKPLNELRFISIREVKS